MPRSCTKTLLTVSLFMSSSSAIILQVNWWSDLTSFLIFVTFSSLLH
jgi:hypothetical protein